MKLITITGPSGAGKDTVARMLSEMGGYQVLCSYTTRPKREGRLMVWNTTLLRSVMCRTTKCWHTHSMVAMSIGLPSTRLQTSLSMSLTRTD